MQQIFTEQYKRLNKAQKDAVDTIEGPVMVIAGPGTGKTSILTLRIANILDKTDTSPENILALTFTESGVFAMRKKLLELIGTSAYKVNINTFHGFCNEIIKQFPEKFPRIIGSTSITEIDQISIMEKIIDNNDFSIIKPFGDIYYYIKPALSEIKNLKKDDISPEKFEEIISKQQFDFDNIPDKVHAKGVHKGKMKGEFIKLRDRINKNKELYKLYSEYEKALVINKFYDFEDMIVEVVRTLRSDSDLLLILQESYQYILADEHQDANNIQNAILELLSNFHSNPNLFIVGDEKQAIYKFQGASLDNFLYFKKLYKDAKIINLEENYRSTQTILDASHSVIDNNRKIDNLERVKLKSKSQNNLEPVNIYEFNTSDDEYNFLIQDIKSKINQGIKANEIAILFRDNVDAFPIAELLSKTDIPYVIESDNDILKNNDIRKLLLIFDSIDDLSNEEKLAKILFIDFFDLNIIEIYKAIEESRRNKIILIDIILQKFPDLAHRLSSWSSKSKNISFIELFSLIVRESGYIDYILSESDSLDRMSILESFFTEIKNLTGSKREYFLSDFIVHIDRVREHGISTRVNKDSNNNDSVKLMTAHRSKGLEFDIVYIVGANDGHWSNKTRRRYFSTVASVEDNSIDDERRLFYVALTRARKLVNISYSKVSSSGRDMLPCQFISEISDEYKINAKHEIKHKINIHSESITHLNHEIKNKKYLQELFLEQGLAVTALNNYLKCPWEYFFKNLIRLPMSQTKYQMYGTAIHNTLQIFFNKYREEQDLSEAELIDLFEFNLKKTPMSVADIKESLAKGKDTLSKYYSKYKGIWNRNLITEYSIRGVHLNTGVFDLILKGNIDKLEFYNDREVNVIDYKTGKKKSENKDNYRRQVIFYKLLLELDDKKKYIMRSGELDFIESQKKEVVEVTDNDIEQLKKLISEKANEIYSLAFWDKNCDDKECEFCKLSTSLVGKE